MEVLAELYVVSIALGKLVTHYDLQYKRISCAGIARMPRGFANLL